MTTIDNLHKRPPLPVAAATNGPTQPTQLANMGPQCQRRLALQGRSHQMQSSQPTKKLKAGDQQTLFGGRAFDPKQDCAVCKGKLWGGDVHRAHHQLCWNNRKTKGVISTATLESAEEDKRLKQHFSEPLQAKDMFSLKCATKEAGVIFFAPRQLTVQNTTTKTTTVAVTVEAPPAKSIDFCKAVTAKIEDPSFVNEHKNSRAPLAMLAFARIVIERIIRGNECDMFDYSLSWFGNHRAAPPELATRAWRVINHSYNSYRLSLMLLSLYYHCLTTPLLLWNYLVQCAGSNLIVDLIREFG